MTTLQFIELMMTAQMNKEPALVGQNGLTLSLNNTASAADGRVLDEELATVLTVQNGLITKIDTYLSDVPMMEKYFTK